MKHKNPKLETITNYILEEMDDVAEDFKLILKKNFEELLNNNYLLYLQGQREDYLFDDEQFDFVFAKTGEEVAEEAIVSLLDKNILSMRVSSEGDIIYSLSELFQQQTSKIFK